MMLTLLYVLQRLAFGIMAAATILACLAQIVGSLSTIGNLR